MDHNTTTQKMGCVMRKQPVVVSKVLALFGASSATAAVVGDAIDSSRVAWNQLRRYV